MESGIQSSFIPQDAAKETRLPNAQKRSGLTDLLFLLSIVMFVASGALAGAVFLYQQYLSTSASSKIDQLKRAKDAFQPALIQDITRLDDRMHAADTILGTHLAPTAFFAALSQATLSTVSFQSLDLEALDPQRITLKMTGVAQSVNSIALQADLFSKNGVITNPIFSDINRQTDGVHFTLTALLNPAAINYVQIVSTLLNQNAQQAGAAGATQETGTPPVNDTDTNSPFSPNASSTSR